MIDGGPIQNAVIDVLNCREEFKLVETRKAAQVKEHGPIRTLEQDLEGLLEESGYHEGQLQEADVDAAEILQQMSGSHLADNLDEDEHMMEKIIETASKDLATAATDLHEQNVIRAVLE
eukprot:10900451-Karenia_brevis.AAC.1